MKAATSATILLVAGFGFSFAACAERSGDGAETARVKAAFPPKNLSDRVLAAAPGYELLRCDAEPSVHVGELAGYRMLLRYDAYESRTQAHEVSPRRASRGSNLGVGSRRHARYMHIDMVLFPDREALPDDMSGRIKWDQLEQIFYTRPVHMGKGHGYHWFARTPVYVQHILREKLGLSGGDDSLDLVIEGLAARGYPRMTVYDGKRIVECAGAKAVPRIVASIGEDPDGDNSRRVAILRFVKNEEATRALLSIYESGDKRLMVAAASVLIRPCRKAAKSAYLDMLRRRLYVQQVAKWCVERQWKEAGPLLEEICEEPGSPGEFWWAFDAKRQLEGRPVPKILKDSEHLIYLWSMTPDRYTEAELQAAKGALLITSDKEAATVLGFFLAVINSKSTRERLERASRIGRDVLQTLPEKVTRPLLTKLLGSIKNEWEKKRCIERLRGIPH